jgi:hypothetical protein
MKGARFPDFIIIGAMKAATSTLHMQIAAQPGIFMTTPKEPNFFSDDDRWSLGLDWYRGLFASASPGDICGEASTHYTKLPLLPDALPRLRASLVDVRLIYMMRHPVDRLISHYSHGWLERTIEGPIDDAVQRHPELVDYGRYAMQIRPWLESFGADAILPVFTERLAAEPQAELERVMKFIGYAGEPLWQSGRDTENVSGERLRDSPSRDRLVYHPVVSAVRRHLVPRTVRNRIKRFWQMRERPRLGNAALSQVSDIFDEDLAKLGRLLGTELNCTTFKTVVREQPLDWI